MRYTEPQDRWWISVYSQNFTNVKVRTNAGRFQMPNGSFEYVSEYLAPRTYGIQFGTSF